MIWEPFVLALVLGLIISAGLYFAYLWPSVEPLPQPLPQPLPDDGDPVTPVVAASERATGQTADPVPGSTSAQT